MMLMAIYYQELLYAETQSLTYECGVGGCKIANLKKTFRRDLIVSWVARAKLCPSRSFNSFNPIVNKGRCNVSLANVRRGDSQS